MKLRELRALSVEGLQSVSFRRAAHAPVLCIAVTRE